MILKNKIIIGVICVVLTIVGYNKLYDTMRNSSFEYKQASIREAVKKNKKQIKELNLPQYEIIQTFDLVAGGIAADILIESFSQDTPKQLRKDTAQKIAWNSGFVQISLFNSLDAKKAAYSVQFQKDHPETKKGFLGSLDENGNFEIFE